MLTNKTYSWIASDEILTSLEFVGFEKTDGSKIGVNTMVMLSRPHWDNDYRIEESFKNAANVYSKSTDQTVLGRVVQGRFKQHPYVTDQGRRAVRATQMELPDVDASGDGDGSGSGSGDGSEAEEDMVVVIALCSVAGVLLLGIPLLLALRSKACLFTQCFSKGSKVVN